MTERLTYTAYTYLFIDPDEQPNKFPSNTSYLRTHDQAEEQGAPQLEVGQLMPLCHCTPRTSSRRMGAIAKEIHTSLTIPSAIFSYALFDLFFHFISAYRLLRLECVGVSAKFLSYANLLSFVRLRFLNLIIIPLLVPPT